MISCRISLALNFVPQLIERSRNIRMMIDGYIDITAQAFLIGRTDRARLVLPQTGNQTLADKSSHVRSLPRAPLPS